MVAEKKSICMSFDIVYPMYLMNLAFIRVDSKTKLD